METLISKARIGLGGVPEAGDSSTLSGVIT